MKQINFPTKIINKIAFNNMCMSQNKGRRRKKKETLLKKK